VPILAPKTIPIACLNVNIWELTKTIVIIMTADEESKRVVTTIPTSRLLNVFDINLCIHLFALSPIIDWIDSDKLFTANKNKTSPAIIESKISVISFLHKKISVNLFIQNYKAVKLIISFR